MVFRRFVSLSALSLLTALLALGPACSSDTHSAPERFDDRYLYEDGVYRGIFADGPDIQVNVELRLRDGVVSEARFRHLRRDQHYHRDTKQEPYASVVRQYEETLAHLVGKELRGHLADLYTPERIVKTEVDGYTAATVRSRKVLSAVRDALNRGVYEY